jgi:hypothetical protein
VQLAAAIPGAADPRHRPPAGAADEDGVALGVEEGTGGEFAHQAGVDRGVGKDELVEVLEDGESGRTGNLAPPMR